MHNDSDRFSWMQTSHTSAGTETIASLTGGAETIAEKEKILQQKLI